MSGRAMPAVDVAAEVRALECMGVEALRDEWRLRRYGAPRELRSADVLKRVLSV